MDPQNIGRIKGSDLDFLIAVLTTAREQYQTVSLAVDGGIKVKRGESMWSAPLGSTLQKEQW